MPETPSTTPAPTGQDRIWLPRSNRSPSLARRFLRELLARLDGGEHFLTDGQLLLSELVTNALLHGTERGRLILVEATISPAALLLEVHDASATLPEPRQATDSDERGRGLLLVDLIADQWGCRPRPGGMGKVTWASCTPVVESSSVPQ